MTRLISAAFVAMLMAGCVNTPNSKALITPVGAVGIHSFAPSQPDRAREVNPDLMAKLEARAEADEQTR
jgi:PBP1b-binding outer membrane lipoprotein LpoB